MLLSELMRMRFAAAETEPSSFRKMIRAWLIGLGVDAIDPGSDCFHAIGFLLLALAYLPLRSLVFRTRFTGWAVWAAICSLVLALVDGWLSGYGDATGRSLVISAGLTALATMG